ncbi:MAG: hypothetical protein LBV68_00635 [Spirochaetaceae bacterium]|jgi:hypothetical protein|nr:hypothetical protein [Spirochaetaceae bacterium]
MAITPLDLQMIFSQLDQIGKEVSSQKEGAALRSVMQNDSRQKIQDEKMKSVHQTDDSGSGPVKTKNNKKDSGEEETSGKKSAGGKESEADGESAGTLPAVHDLNLGKYVDISG